MSFVIIITSTCRSFVVFDVHLLDSETTKAAYSSITLAVVRAVKPGLQCCSCNVCHSMPSPLPCNCSSLHPEVLEEQRELLIQSE